MVENVALQFAEVWCWGPVPGEGGGGVPPGPWNPNPVYDKKFEKILKNWYPVCDFQTKFHSFFLQNAWFLDPVYKKIFENLSIWNPVYERTVEKPYPEGRNVPV